MPCESTSSHGPAWDLKHLGGDRDGRDYAPPESRADFMRVVEGCTSLSAPPERQTPTTPPA